MKGENATMMTSKEILDNFSKIDSKTLVAAKYIVGQNPFLYEEEYGVDVVHYTDSMLSDMLLVKKKYYRLFYLSKAILYYRQFYDYCIDCGYIEYNPVDKNSLYFSYEYMMRKIVDLGNIDLYSKDYVISRCNTQGNNSPYYRSIALSIYEGVKDCNILAQIKYDDVDFNNRMLTKDELNIPISDKLIESYQDMYSLKIFEVPSNKLGMCFDDSNGMLIRQLVRNGETKASGSPIIFRKSLTKRIVELALDGAFLYDSGLIFRLIDILGKDKLIEILDYDETRPKIEKINNNVLMQNALLKAGSTLSSKNFVYEYRVYGLCLKYNKIK